MDDKSNLEFDRVFSERVLSILTNHDLGQLQKLEEEMLTWSRTRPEPWWTIGYLRFHLVKRGHVTELRPGVEGPLSLAITLAPTSSYAQGAWWYLASEAFEAGCFELAQSRVAMVDRELLDTWEVFKVEELELCIRIRMFGLTTVFPGLEAFAARLSLADPIDANPLLLAQTLNEKKEDLSPEDLITLIGIGERLDEVTKTADWFQRIIRERWGPQS